MSAALYEVVLARGRVLDPESGLDAIRDVGIAEGRVVALSEAELSALWEAIEAEIWGPSTRGTVRSSPLDALSELAPGSSSPHGDGESAPS